MHENKLIRSTTLDLPICGEKKKKNARGCRKKLSNFPGILTENFRIIISLERIFYVWIKVCFLFLRGRPTIPTVDCHQKHLHFRRQVEKHTKCQMIFFQMDLNDTIRVRVGDNQKPPPPYDTRFLWNDC